MQKGYYYVIQSFDSNIYMFLFSYFSHFQAKQPLKSILKQFIQGKNH